MNQYLSLYMTQQPQVDYKMTLFCNKYLQPQSRALKPRY